MLTASFTEADRRLVNSAIQAHAFENKAARSILPSLSYASRAGRARYVRNVRLLERRLRAVMDRLERWQLELASDLEVVPLGPMLEMKGVVAAAAVRQQQARNGFLLVSVRGRIAARAGLPVSAARLTLELDSATRRRSRRAIAWSMFPEAEGRVFRGTSAIYGLRPNLKFWVPKLPGGVAHTRASELDSAVRRMMVVGPEAMSFRSLELTGSGVGSSRLDWRFRSRGGVIRRQGFILRMVLRVPRGRTSVRVKTTLEGPAVVPGVLAGVMGKFRFVRDSGHWEVPVPRALGRLPRRAR